MSVEWRPVRQSRTHELVLESIEERVLAGELKVGDRLPPERELAEVLGVSRSALREALRVLETIGVLVAQAGRGPDAGARIVMNPDDALGRVLRLHFALGGYRLEDVLEARVVLERSSFRTAAEHASADDVDVAGDLLERMCEPDIAVPEFNDLDTRFHVQIARGSGNRLTSTLTSAVRESVRPLILRALEAVEDWPATAATLNAEHTELLRLVREGRGEEAADLVERHIRGFHGRLVAQDEGGGAGDGGRGAGESGDNGEGGEGGEERGGGS
ncbi:FadR/GntR family transcriptional regulator [Streptomyces sp. GC420]|uniref:FadR/GntR family transcriptional regulator n=1 Tax=Streptomyces sp. GC420 TaxID=2697568 RepID=UPI001414F88C|nr:FCD domain-containing protein [Streptomyces sp. GC420]NBM19200.1 FCD domain-containing protein [Streptomyces sp. GC420]